MAEAPGETARRFHEVTKHSYESVRLNRHYLDWQNQPIPFKIYRDVTSTPLPPVSEAHGISALEALRPTPAAPRETALGPADLSRLLFHAAGITKRSNYGGGQEMLFRAAACTGALYHIEIYVVKEDGVFHYDPREHALDHLRSGDWRRSLVEATGDDERVATAEAVLVLTTTYWRNAWKYQSRAYRHAFWDGGTILAHVLAMARALLIPAQLVPLFADPDLERLLDIDPEEEGVVTLVSLGISNQLLPPTPGSPEPLGLETVPLSRSRLDYPLIVEMHRDSSLESGADARALREAPALGKQHETRPEIEASFHEPLESVIRRRGSARRFERQPIDAAALTSILDSATLDIMLGDLYVIVNDVDGLARGTYVHGDMGLTLLREGDFRSEAGYLDLGQPLAADAAVNVYVLTDLEPALARYGDRGYRVAALEGGLLGGRLYLAAYAWKLGATGLTFYDDAVTEFFSPHARGKSVMFLVAMGVRGKRPRL
ncbi:MAG TPA: SagB family peptide dehydrogenase [Vicinamibacteria bacterium]|nr:SagB family peptide dehydrogenase [Vicinamibacteria bacterium]